jgi:hypothetical protein
MKAAAEKLQPRQERAILALLECGEIKAAAEKAKVGEATLHRWLQEPAFQSQYNIHRRQVVEAAITELQSASSVAVRTLKSICEDGAAPASSRVAAAKAILEQGVNAVEQSEIKERIKALEDLIKQSKGMKR